MSRKSPLGLLVQSALGLTIMLAGWGFDDLGGFFAHPARAGLLVVSLLSLAFVIVKRIDLQVFRKGARPLGRQRIVLALAMGVSIVLIWLLPHGDRRGWLTFEVADALRYVGLVLHAGGNVLAFLAVRALGKQYSGYVTLQDDHQLVQTGIYGVIRHPIYLRALMVSVGLPLVFRSWLVLPTVVLVVLFVNLRIRMEEKLLAEHFGEAFDVYKQRTFRLLPYVY